MTHFLSNSKTTFAFAILFLLPFQSQLLAQGTIADYERMNRQFQITSNKVFRTNVKPNWIFDDSGLWYRIESAPKEFEFVFVNLKEKKRELAFDHTEVARQLTEISKQKVTAGNLPFTTIDFDSKFKSAFFRWRGKHYRIDRDSSQVESITAAELPPKKSTASIPVSGPSRIEIHVSFKNERKSAIQLFWVDSNGEAEAMDP